MSQYRKSMDLILCQISKLLPGTDFLILTDKDVRRQEGFDDCGLFVLAYMFTLCSGQDPSFVTYKQKEMRGHFGKLKFLTNVLMSCTKTYFLVS